MDRARGRWLVVALGALLALGLGGCRPLYLPPVPSTLPPFPQELRLAEARILATGEQRVVVVVPERVPRSGWLAVQWFPPAGEEIASASRWITPEDVARTVRIVLPTGVAIDREGRWRALLSFEGRIVRQLDWIEPAGP